MDFGEFTDLNNDVYLWRVQKWKIMTQTGEKFGGGSPFVDIPGVFR